VGTEEVDDSIPGLVKGEGDFSDTEVLFLFAVSIFEIASDRYALKLLDE
tara:strand:- start:8 stop:154 length:147 start_codon:yes stop_codon:yes gene_type:complete